MYVDDMERGLREARERRGELADALMESARNLWFAAELAATFGNGNDAFSVSLQRNAWKAERIANGYTEFMTWAHSEIRPRHADRLPSLDL